LKSKVRSFREFYDGVHEQFLRQFFPKMPDYFNFLKQRLISQGLRLIARCKQNIIPNSEEEKRTIKKWSIIETVIGKFTNFFGATLSRFRSPQAAFSAIYAGILAVNFPLYSTIRVGNFNQYSDNALLAED
jgi:hypothetical protein